MSLDNLDVRALLAVYGSHGAFGATMVAMTILGNGWCALALAPLVGRSSTRRFGCALGLAIAWQAVLVWAIKLAVGRVRPWIALGLPRPIGGPLDPSFPSGHAAGSFCVATFLVLALPAAWPERPWRRRALAALLFGVAGLIALSRVCLGAHYPSDVVGGACLGAFIGGLAAGRYASARAS
jgi:undecaprenyl-diphosphatase